MQQKSSEYSQEYWTLSNPCIQPECSAHMGGVQPPTGFNFHVIFLLGKLGLN